MLANLRVQTSLKALLLLGLGFFLFTRLTGGTLYYYISERFGWLTVVAALGLFLLGISYRTGRRNEEAEASAGCEHDHTDGHAGHDHPGHDHPGHDHAIGWGGLLIVALPILFGLLIPPRPLGSTALAAREMNVSGVPSALPAAVQGATAKADTERSVLDWVLDFQASGTDGENFAGRSAHVMGFVHREADDPADAFWLTRYVVGCCVVDAMPVGLRVVWPDAPALEADSWVRVEGQLAENVSAAAPWLEAQSVVVIPPPNQPYLYP